MRNFYFNGYKFNVLLVNNYCVIKKSAFTGFFFINLTGKQILFIATSHPVQN
jgi:hypothetical protein